jgi:hypothetical protein
MSANKFAESVEEFDRRFDEGEDIHDLVDMTKAKIIRHGKKVRITIDIAEELVHEIDQIRQSIGVDRAALIKILLHERVQQEKSGMSSR